MEFRLMFPKKYLKAEDLDGKEATLTIRAVVREEMYSHGGETEKKWCLYFEETKKKAEANDSEEKRMVCNVTNGLSVIEATGETDGTNWIGKRITLYTGQAMNPQLGRMAPALRIRDAAPAPVTVDKKETK